jgi:hypothetical protein
MDSPIIAATVENSKKDMSFWGMEQEKGMQECPEGCRKTGFRSPAGCRMIPCLRLVFHDGLNTSLADCGLKFCQRIPGQRYWDQDGGSLSKANVHSDSIENTLPYVAGA